MSNHKTSILLRTMLNTAITAVENYNSSLNLGNTDNAFMELSKFMTIQKTLAAVQITLKLSPTKHAAVGVDNIEAISLTCPFSDELPAATIAESMGFDEYDTPNDTVAYMGMYSIPDHA